MASKSLCGISNAMYSGNLTGDSRASSLICFQPWLRPSRTDDPEVPATRRVELEEESEPRFNRPALYRVPAALVMSTTCGMLQLAAQALESPSPGEVLAQVNETLVARIPSNMFVTCFYAVLDPISASLRYSNAGHDLPYLHSGRGEAEELRARGLPLGLMPGMGYEQKEIELDVGEGVFFYSDGLVEAHDPKGEMFGFPRLRALVAEHGKQGSLEEALLEELYSFVGEGWEQEDDITLLTLKRCATLS